MARAAATLLVLLLIMAYVSLFLSWNGEAKPIVTWQIGSKYSQDMPVGLLFIIGVLVGAVAMTIALWTPWNRLRASEQQQRALVDKARKKLKSQAQEIEQLTQAAEAQEDAGDEVGLSPAEAAAVAAAAPPGDAAQPEKPPTAEDDPEVI